MTILVGHNTPVYINTKSIIQIISTYSKNIMHQDPKAKIFTVIRNELSYQNVMTPNEGSNPKENLYLIILNLSFSNRKVHRKKTPKVK